MPEPQRTITVDVRLVPSAREALAQVWDAALDHAWELSDPLYTIAPVQAAGANLRPVLTGADIRQAKQENPYRD